MDKSTVIGRKCEAKNVRASVSFPCDLYRTLESIAKEKKVSVAWVVRDASEKYAKERAEPVSAKNES